ncbi:MAG: UDP-3-O-acyl-N-acetylglucosamine deacetylase, partial [Muribaculaceae bacterium]
MKQRTLKKSFSVEGKGLHTGVEIEATFNPAPDNSGIQFQRIDLEGKPIIYALAENVSETQRGTVLAKGDAKVSTVEHALAALYAAGIDNCLIEINAAELPILDGSAKEYSEKIEDSGIDEQKEEKDYYIVKQKIEVRDDITGSSITVLPDDDFSIDTMVAFESPVLSNQYATLINLDDFKEQISASRTFVFVREIELLVKNNLIKGGDLDNAIVIYDSPISQSELDRLADLMNVPHKNVTEYGYVNNKPLVADN